MLSKYVDGKNKWSLLDSLNDVKTIPCKPLIPE
jgi:hypothetical protein